MQDQIEEMARKIVAEVVRRMQTRLGGTPNTHAVCREMTGERLTANSALLRAVAAEMERRREEMIPAESVPSEARARAMARFKQLREAEAAAATAAPGQ